MKDEELVYDNNIIEGVWAQNHFDDQKTYVTSLPSIIKQERIFPFMKGGNASFGIGYEVSIPMQRMKEIFRCPTNKTSVENSELGKCRFQCNSTEHQIET